MANHISFAMRCNEFLSFPNCNIFQDSHNQAGIAHEGGLVPLLKLLDSKNGSLQHNAAFALYGIADNEVRANKIYYLIMSYLICQVEL